MSEDAFRLFGAESLGNDGAFLVCKSMDVDPSAEPGPMMENGRTLRSLVDLPEELLEHILSFLSPYQQHKTAALVCRQWHRLVKGVAWQCYTGFIRAIKEGSIHWESRTYPYPGTPITQRFSHSACYYDVNHSMYVFGGCTQSSCNAAFNDLWRLDLNSREWIRPLASGSYPSPKAGATMVVYKDLLVLFGGWTRPSPYPLHQPERFFDEIHTYSPSKNWWNCIVTPQGPLPIAGHSATVVGTKMIVFGGYLGWQQMNNDVWVLELDQWTWSKVLTQGTKPQSRVGQSQIVLDDTTLLIIGGCGGPNAVFKDTWLLHLDLVPWAWEQVKVKNEEHGAPELWCHPACKVGDCVVVFSQAPSGTAPLSPSLHSRPSPIGKSPPPVPGSARTENKLLPLCKDQDHEEPQCVNGRWGTLRPRTHRVVSLGQQVEASASAAQSSSTFTSHEHSFIPLKQLPDLVEQPWDMASPSNTSQSACGLAGDKGASHQQSDLRLLAQVTLQKWHRECNTHLLHGESDISITGSSVGNDDDSAASGRSRQQALTLRTNGLGACHNGSMTFQAGGSKDVDMPHAPSQRPKASDRPSGPSTDNTWSEIQQDSPNVAEVFDHDSLIGLDLAASLEKPGAEGLDQDSGGSPSSINLEACAIDSQLEPQIKLGTHVAAQVHDDLENMACWIPPSAQVGQAQGLGNASRREHVEPLSTAGKNLTCSLGPLPPRLAPRHPHSLSLGKPLYQGSCCKPMRMYVLDVGHAHSGLVAWKTLGGSSLTGPPETSMHSVVHGRGELVIFGGLVDRKQNIKYYPRSNALYFVQAKR
uniref:F-box protein 42 n=2 Tax=Eptatretus burgeri TaxID=7764 RepID=A0A8C4NI08_EPTBU